jgi:hypothetical protein
MPHALRPSRKRILITPFCLGHFHYCCREFRIVILTLSAANGEETPHFLRGATLYTIRAF